MVGSLVRMALKSTAIPALVRFHLNQINQAYRCDVSLTPAALALLTRHGWPGNVRQLSNMLERMALLTPHSMLDAPDVRLTLDNDLHSSAGAVAQSETMDQINQGKLVRLRCGIVARRNSTMQRASRPRSRRAAATSRVLHNCSG